MMSLIRSVLIPILKERRPGFIEDLKQKRKMKNKANYEKKKTPSHLHAGAEASAPPVRHSASQASKKINAMLSEEKDSEDDSSSDESDFDFENLFCTKCQKAGNDEMLMLCDGKREDGKRCNNGMHTECAGYKSVPEESYYCRDCLVSMEQKSFLMLRMNTEAKAETLARQRATKAKVDDAIGKMQQKPLPSPPRRTIFLDGDAVSPSKLKSTGIPSSMNALNVLVEAAALSPKMLNASEDSNNKSVLHDDSDFESSEHEECAKETTPSVDSSSSVFDVRFDKGPMGMKLKVATVLPYFCVKTLIPGGAAEALGVQIDDMVVAIEHKPLPQFIGQTVFSELLNAAGRPVTITFKKANTIDVPVQVEEKTPSSTLPVEVELPATSEPPVEVELRAASEPPVEMELPATSEPPVEVELRATSEPPVEADSSIEESVNVPGARIIESKRITRKPMNDVMREELRSLYPVGKRIEAYTDDAWFPAIVERHLLDGFRVQWHNSSLCTTYQFEDVAESFRPGTHTPSEIPTHSREPKRALGAKSNAKKARKITETAKIDVVDLTPKEEDLAAELTAHINAKEKELAKFKKMKEINKFSSLENTLLHKIKTTEDELANLAEMQSVLLE